MAPLSAVPLLAEVTALWHRKVELTQKVLDEEEKALTVGSRQELERDVDALAANHARLVGGPALARLPVVRDGDSAAAAGSSEDRLEEHASTSDLRILLDIAEGARGSIGPADVDRAMAEYRRDQCRVAVATFPETPADNHAKFFKAKLELAERKNANDVRVATMRVEEARERYRQLVPLIGSEVSVGLKRTEAAYAKAMDDQQEKAPRELATLVEVCNRINAETALLVPNDTPGVQMILIEVMVDGAPAEGRLLTAKEQLAYEVQHGKLGVDETRVLLLEKEQDTWKPYNEAYAVVKKVSVGAVIGGRPELSQTLRLVNAEECWKPHACYVVFQDAAKTLEPYEDCVEAVVMKVMAEHSIADTEVDVLFADIKKYDRACAKANEKYHGDFSRLLDLVRLTIACTEVKYVTLLINGIHIDPKLKILRIKNRLDPAAVCASSAGYRDVLINVEFVPTHHICELQLTLASFREIKHAEGHDCYKVSRTIGMNTRDVSSYTGALDSEALNRVKYGVIQTLNLDGTPLPEEPVNLRAMLLSREGLASEWSRLVELNIGHCFTRSAYVPPITEVLSVAVLRSIAATIQVIDMAKNKMPGKLAEVDFSACRSLTTLRLGSNRLNGKIPESICTLTKLQFLFLEKNELSGAIPTNIGDLASLVKLNFYKNQLTGPIPPSVAKLTLLRELFLFSNKLMSTGGKKKMALPDLSALVDLVKLGLNDNRLSGPLPAWLGSLPNLEMVFLQDNEFAGPIPRCLGGMPAIHMLYLQNNRLTGDIPPELGSLTHLTRFKLLGNDFTLGPIPPEFAHLSQLEVVELPFAAGDYSEAFLKDLPSLAGLHLLNAIKGLSLPDTHTLFTRVRLTDLNLSDNGLVGHLPAGLLQLVHLERLNLEKNAFDGSIPDWLGQLPALKTINLKNNRLIGVIPDAVGSLAKLTTLALSGNRLHGPVPSTFARLKTLQMLAVDGTALSDDLPRHLLALPRLVSVHTAPAWTVSFSAAVVKAASNGTTSIASINGTAVTKLTPAPTVASVAASAENGASRRTKRPQVAAFAEEHIESSSTERAVGGGAPTKRSRDATTIASAEILASFTTATPRATKGVARLKRVHAEVDTDDHSDEVRWNMLGQ